MELFFDLADLFVRIYLAWLLFWFHKRITKLEQENQIVKRKLSKYE